MNRAEGDGGQVDAELERELIQAASDVAATTGTSFDEAYRAIVDRVNLEAENKRLREALEEIARIDFRGYPHESARIARKALHRG